MAVMVELDHLSKSFGELHAVDNISLTVSKGEVLGFLGPNGAGKSTTMRMVAGFLQPTAGTARVCGHDVVAEPTAVKRIIGYMPEGSPSYEDMDVGGFLKFIAAVRGFSKKELAGRVADTAARVGLTEVLERPIGVLSKGYRRRVGLAQAIIHDPPVLILDEPTDGLDPNQKHQVRTLIRAMAPEKAIIVSTHILEEVQAVCTRAVIIGHGRVLADGTADELLARLPDHLAVCVIVPNAAAAATATALRALPNVAAIFETEAGGRTRLRLTPKTATPLIDQVAALVREQKLQVVEVFEDRGNLDDVFRLITTGSVTKAAA